MLVPQTVPGVPYVFALEMLGTHIGFGALGICCNLLSSTINAVFCDGMYAVPEITIRSGGNEYALLATKLHEDAEFVEPN